MRWGQTGNFCSPPSSRLLSPSQPPSSLIRPYPKASTQAFTHQSKTTIPKRLAGDPLQNSSRIITASQFLKSLATQVFPPFLPVPCFRPFRRLLTSRLLLQLSVSLLLLLLVPVAVVQGAEESGGGQRTGRAILEIVLYNPVENGGYVTQSYKLVGMFSLAGAAISAEGRIIQVRRLVFISINS
ncbi:E3 ubiquitin-protein ligase znrf3 [Plakobranchus ocellatus]|uniref:E3 ubiquitin-protein ligase znrf3 n=1 Tax=Plakobranchus ocellatus TaxID=259542 RepID=A0AAV3ZY22_9GAST|nr:E3 ubiquitin-protein ligase znrf3 [Plakobranchus ocellatus]